MVGLGLGFGVALGVAVRDGGGGLGAKAFSQRCRPWMAVEDPTPDSTHNCQTSPASFHFSMCSNASAYRVRALP